MFTFKNDVMVFVLIDKDFFVYICVLSTNLKLFLSKPVQASTSNGFGVHKQKQSRKRSLKRHFFRFLVSFPAINRCEDREIFLIMA